MSCPYSLYPSGIHSWRQYRNGRMLGNWRCLQCGGRRRRRRNK